MTVQKTEHSSVARAIKGGSAPISRNLERDYLAITRLLVLVPTRGIDNLALARYVWSLSRPCRIPVVFVGLSRRRSEDESAARLRLATLAAMTRDDDVAVSTHIEPTDNWIHVVNSIWQPGDVVICMAEHTAPLHLGGQNPLWQALEIVLDVPVYVIDGIYKADTASARGQSGEWLPTWRALSNLIVPLVIAGSFFLMQLHIGAMTAGLNRVGLLCVSGMVEVGLIGAWRVLNH
ncbi:MAG: hypothetical protein M1140_10265 [Chloroflexi bacterium]|nr:hypothetical protein [Chloroflexota bacterium]